MRLPYFLTPIYYQRRKRFESQIAQKIVKGSETQLTGTLGEYHVGLILLKKGYRVETGGMHGIDLYVNGRVQVEVKTSEGYVRVGCKGKEYNFNTKFSYISARFNPHKVLVCRCLSDPIAHFVIPYGKLVSNETGLTITFVDPYDYTGKWSQYREAWYWIDCAIANDKLCSLDLAADQTQIVDTYLINAIIHKMKLQYGCMIEDIEHEWGYPK